ncbi:MAG: hypothetical protein AB7J13_12085 [Pyrinomonadaceae bacterium]
MALVGEARFIGNYGQRHPALDHKLRCVIDTKPMDIFAYRKPEELTKQ